MKIVMAVSLVLLSVALFMETRRADRACDDGDKDHTGRHAYCGGQLDPNGETDDGAALEPKANLRFIELPRVEVGR